MIMINDNKNITTNTKTDIGKNSDTNTSNDNYDNNGIIADDNIHYYNKSNPTMMVNTKVVFLDFIASQQ